MTHSLRHPSLTLTKTGSLLKFREWKKNGPSPSRSGWLRLLGAPAGFRWPCSPSAWRRDGAADRRRLGGGRNTRSESSRRGGKDNQTLNVTHSGGKRQEKKQALDWKESYWVQIVPGLRSSWGIKEKNAVMSLKVTASGWFVSQQGSWEIQSRNVSFKTDRLLKNTSNTTTTKGHVCLFLSILNLSWRF